MTAMMKSWLGRFAGGLAFGLMLLTAGVAVAGGNGCGCTPPPPCCTPPTPPTPPSYPCCQPPGHTVNIPGVSVNVAASVVVEANVSANVVANANAAASGSAFGQSSGQAYFVSGGGGYGGAVGPGATTVVQGLNVDGGGLRRSAYESSRTKLTKVVIQAVCIDDKDIPHPASQVTPDRDIDDAYDGEIYRCIAGTHMQYVWAEYLGKIAFDHGQTVNCAKAQALWHAPGGKVECRVQKPARDCNERSLLRRFGAGVKILTMVTIERYTDYHEETAQTGGATALALDGGVGGVVY